VFRAGPAQSLIDITISARRWREKPFDSNRRRAQRITRLPRPESEQLRWFTENVQPHDAPLKAYLRRAFPSVRDVDDLVQESYLRMWKARLGKPIPFARAFLFKLARHIALNFVARQRKSPVAVVGDLGAMSVMEDRRGIPDSVDCDDVMHLLVEALGSLPPRCREITILRKLHGVPQREIATRLAISEKTVEEQVSRGVRRCEEFLRRRGITKMPPL
jgi:RNA polymerase sigma-70 factor (ECF subfamily)